MEYNINVVDSPKFELKPVHNVPLVMKDESTTVVSPMDIKKTKKKSELA